MSEAMTESRRRDAVMLGIGALVIVLDQLTKHWIVRFFVDPEPYTKHPPIPLVGSVLELTFVQNRGVAFSLLQGNALQFLFITVALIAIGTLYWRSRETGSFPLKASFGLVLGGAFGNLVDRLGQGYVVDFVHFHLGGFDFPVFNVADMGITCGVALLAFLLWSGVPSDTEATAKQPVATPASDPGGR
jgi:signal peptidase II